jgi:hypothetical protein
VVVEDPAEDEAVVLVDSASVVVDELVPNLGKDEVVVVDMECEFYVIRKKKQA